MTTVQRTWSFGALAKVVVNTDEAAWEEMDYLLKLDGMAELLAGRVLHVIGEADMMSALVRLDDSPTVHLLVPGETHQLVPVASSVTALAAFLDDVASLWVGHEGEYGLPVTTDNLELARLMLDGFLDANPGCDTGFWEYQCFAGLNMGFELG